MGFAPRNEVEDGVRSPVLILRGSGFALAPQDEDLRQIRILVEASLNASMFSKPS
jgi:hypothetical protein